MRTDDGCIIHECLNGEPEAFGVLVDKYKSGIYAFAYAKLGNFHDAQDVTQEAFLKAYRNLHSLRRWESFGFWLYRITSNLCKEWLKARSRRPDLESTEDQDSGTLEASSLNSHRENRLYESVQEAMHSLPESYREVLVLCYFGGMDSKEVAKALGISPAAVRMRLSRARMQLREEMITMMDTAFEGQRLRSTFTFRIVEAVKRIKVNPMPRMAGLPWGLSMVVCAIVTVLSSNSDLSSNSAVYITRGLQSTGELRVLKTGEIPIDLFENQDALSVGTKVGKHDGRQHNAFLAPDAEIGIWTKKTNVPQPPPGMGSATVVNGKVYFIGGWPCLSDVTEYDPETDTWTRKADMPIGRQNLSCSAVNGRIYVMGGWNKAEGYLSSVYEYDVVADKWSEKADMPTTRLELSTCVANGRIYAIGGWRDLQNFSVVEEYDPALDKWTRKANMSTARESLAASSVNGKIYAIGGWDNMKVHSLVEEYDPQTDTWTRKSSMPTARCDLSTSVVNGKIYAIGGWDNVEYFSVMEEYDPATDAWKKKTDMLSARAFLITCSVNARIYAFGGWDDDRIDNMTVEEYDTGFRDLGVRENDKLPTKWGEVKKSN